jgi:hypothetical protein
VVSLSDSEGETTSLIFLIAALKIVTDFSGQATALAGASFLDYARLFLPILIRLE